jgi:hypothetical protein
MTKLAKIAGPAALVAVLAFAAPAQAQFAGGGMEQMQQFAPMLEMMKQKMGKRRFGQLMQTMGPMMAQMAGGSGAMGGFGGSTGFGGMSMTGGGFDMGQITSMIGSMQSLMGSGRRKARRPRA